jgi:hypothetical protein
MEEVRTDASKANKIINMAMKGNMSLKSIVSSTTERSSTGSLKKNKSKNRSGSSDNNGDRGLTHSAGDIASRHHGDSMRFDKNDSHDPLPYISPYELNSGNNKSQKITL